MTGYYRKFIENYAKEAKPLTKLLKKQETFNWTEECEKAFEFFIQKLTTNPILVYPDFEKTFYLTTDASQFAIGGVLAQEDLEQNLRPIAYVSCTLQKAELNYSTIEKEMLAIVECVTENFHVYLCIWSKLPHPFGS